MPTEPFILKECVALENPIGATAASASELLDRVQTVDDNVLYNHLFLPHLRQRNVRWEYPNDFARWAAYFLNDFVLAEELANYSPFERKDMALVREDVIGILEDHIAERGGRDTVPPGREFYFCGSTTLVFDSGYVARDLKELRDGLDRINVSGIYYHFFEAFIRQTEAVDDISFWVAKNLNIPDLVQRLRNVDFYFLSLSDIKDRIVRVLGNYLAENNK
jgi:hypothetical protein